MNGISHNTSSLTRSLSVIRDFDNTGREIDAQDERNRQRDGTFTRYRPLGRKSAPNLSGIHAECQFGQDEDGSALAGTLPKVGRKQRRSYRTGRRTFASSQSKQLCCVQSSQNIAWFGNSFGRFDLLWSYGQGTLAAQHEAFAHSCVWSICHSLT